MGFEDVRSQVIASLKTDRFKHARRVDIFVKNLLFAGVVDEAFVVKLIGKYRPEHYDSSPHDVIPHVTVDIFRVHHGGSDWYIKTHFAFDQDLVTLFISVHP